MAMKRSNRIRRIWMYQLNPVKGTKFISPGRRPVPTSAKNLLDILIRQGPVEGPWYITKNFYEAKPGDRIIVRVNQGKRDEKVGLIGTGFIEDIKKARPRLANIWIRFDMRRTRRLMKTPIPLHVVRSVIPKHQANIGNVTSYHKHIDKWLNGTALRSVPPNKRAGGRWEDFDPDKKPGRRRVAKALASPEETAQLNEQANRGHRKLLAQLSKRLSDEGWSDVQEMPGAVDLRGTNRRKRVLFEAKTITRKNEIHQIRLGLAQLLEYRFKHGVKGDALCLVTDYPISSGRANFMASLGVAVMWPHKTDYMGNVTAKRVLGGLLCSQ
jgi:hypothetical protein